MSASGSHADSARADLEFGIAVVPATEDLDRLRALVRVADEAPLDLVGIQDHAYQHHFLDTWSLIPTLLADTTRIALFTDVANLPLRPPAVMAKAAASLDVLSGGRFELGLGAGAFPNIAASMGGPRRTAGESVEALEEAIDVIRMMCGRASARSPSTAATTRSMGRVPGPSPLIRSASGWERSGRVGRCHRAASSSQRPAASVYGMFVYMIVPSAWTMRSIPLPCD